MPIGKALLLKGLGGLAALGGAIGGGCYIYNRNRNLDTKFDRGLIEFLEADNSTNIQFSVKDGNGSSSTEITDNFPTFTNGTPTKTATVTIKVSVDATASTGGTNDGTLTDKTNATDGALGTKKYLQKLNGDGTNDGTAWTWVCEVKFTVENTTDASTLTLADKDKLVKNNDGFFNKLKDTDATNKHKDLKIKFIKDCAAARGKDKNKKIDKLTSLTATDEVITTANKIESTKTFKLRKGVTASGEEEGKLYPVDKSDFNYWFGIK